MATSGKNTWQYRNMIACTADLTDAVAKNLAGLCPRLVAVKLIDNDQSEEFTNDRNPSKKRAADLVSAITNRVSLNTKHFHTFVGVLEDDPTDRYEDIVKKLLKQSDTVRKEPTGEPIHDPTPPVKSAADPTDDAAKMLLNPVGVDITSTQPGTGGRVNIDQDDPKELPQYGEEFAKELETPSGLTEIQLTAIKEIKFFNQEVIIIVVINQDEYRAVCSHMKPLEVKEVSTLITLVPSITLGTFGGCNTAVVRADMGGMCQENIKGALDTFPNAKAIIAVGVAYAVSNKEPYALANVLASNEIYGFGNARLNSNGTVEARDLMLIDRSPFQKQLLEAFTLHRDNWKDFKVSQDGRHAKVHAGAIASCPLLVDSKTARDSIVQKVPKMIGGEMEGGELLKIQKEYQRKSRIIGIVIVKGISDFADGSKNKEWQLTAAMAAANYVETIISGNRLLFKNHIFAEN